MKQLTVAEEESKGGPKETKTKNRTEDAILTLERQKENLKNSSDPDDPKAKITKKKQINDIEGRIMTLKQSVEKGGAQIIASTTRRLEQASKEANTNDLFQQYVTPTRSAAKQALKDRYETAIKGLKERIARSKNQGEIQQLRVQLDAAQDGLTRCR